MFQYFEGRLHCDGVPLSAIASEAGTPCYVYSAAALRGAYQEYDFAFGAIPHSICYAVKANSNLAVLKVLADEGSGFDIVSGGELYRVLQAGGDPAKVVFSGVGKTVREIEYAISAGIHSFNCESEGELAALDEAAGRLNATARFSLRINPDVDAATHPYISTGLTEHKFGIDFHRAPAVYEHAHAYRNLVAEGVSCHIGSQILDPAPVFEAAAKLLDLALRLRAAGHPLKHLDIGGGLGISYKSDDPAPGIRSFVQALREPIQAAGFEIFVEPGRSIAGQAGMLLTQVLYRKKNGAKEFVIVDAAMNDLIRPALYQSHHEVIPLERSARSSLVDIVGPVCESGDFFARGRVLEGAEAGDFLGIASSGAYGFSQSSNYNSRPRAAEILVDNGRWRIVRERETFQDLTRGERV